MDPQLTVEATERRRLDADLGLFVRLMWEGVAKRSSMPTYVPMIFQCYWSEGVVHLYVLDDELPMGTESIEKLAADKLRTLDMTLVEAKGEYDGE